MKRVVVVLVVVVLVIGLGAFAFLKIAANGFSAKAEPTALEKFAARSARRLAAPSSLKSRQNPAPATEEALSEARAHWADHCASCHANNGSGDTEMGRNMYPRAPDMRKSDTQDLSDGELFFIIENGIRLTGMPAWGAGTAKSEEDSWKLVRFIRHLPQLSDDEEQEMKKMTPKTPAELEEEKEVEEFLKGE
ncbi:MAG: c-type cytochrome, partial [Acidobacteriales bacterium]|nr:c-type cytochrome [Terriglobales bacterium]